MILHAGIYYPEGYDMRRCLSHEELLQLKRWNTPTIYNGWEQITKHDRTKGCMNLEETRDFMPQMGLARHSGKTPQRSFIERENSIVLSIENSRLCAGE